MNPRLKKIKVVSAFCVSFLFLWLSLKNIDFSLPLAGIKLEKYLYFLMSIFFMSASFYIQAIRWRQYINKPTSKHINTFPSVTIGHFYNAILPFKSGEFIKAYHLSNKYKLSFINIISTCFSDRLFDLIFIVILALVFLNSYFFDNFSVLFSLFIILGFLSIIILSSKKSVKGLCRVVLAISPFKKIKPLLFKSILEVYNGLSWIKNKNKLFKISLYTLILWSINLMGNYFLLKASLLPSEFISFHLAFIITIFTVFAYALPSAPSSIGTYNYAVHLAIVFYLKNQNITIDNSLYNLIAISTLIFFTASIIPDITIGGYYVLKEGIKSYPKPSKA